MLNELKFESEAGQNIKLSRDHREATWTPVNSDGWMYSARAVVPGESVKFVLEGSGHCHVGFTTENPEARNASKQMLKMKKLNDIRLHKRTCRINLTLEDNNKEVFSVFDGKRFSKKVSKDCQVWAAAFVKFGTVSITLHSKGIKLSFSSNHGSNILLEDNNRKASTISNNPAATCVFNINVGETVHMQCSPVTEESRDPSRYHLNMQVSNYPATELKRHFPGMYDSCADQSFRPSLTSLEMLEKEACKGTISLTLTANNMLEYTTSCGKKNQQQLQYISSRHVWIVLEPYRVSVKLLERTEKAKCLNARMHGVDEVDSRIREPSNCNAENSMEVMNQSNSMAVQPYVSVTEAKQIMASQAYPPTNNEYRSMCTCTPGENIWKRMDRIEDRQEEMLHLLHESIPQASKSPLYVYSSADRDELLSNADLQPHWVDLINNMRVDSLCDHLYQQSIIDDNDMHRILSLNKDDHRDANRKLLHILVKKHVKRSVLSKILDDAQESHLKPMFFPE